MFIIHQDSKENSSHRFIHI